MPDDATDLRIIESWEALDTFDEVLANKRSLETTREFAQALCAMTVYEACSDPRRFIRTVLESSDWHDHIETRQTAIAGTANRKLRRHLREPGNLAGNIGELVLRELVQATIKPFHKISKSVLIQSKRPIIPFMQDVRLEQVSSQSPYNYRIMQDTDELGEFDLVVDVRRTDGGHALYGLDATLSQTKLRKQAQSQDNAFFRLKRIAEQRAETLLTVGKIHVQYHQSESSIAPGSQGGEIYVVKVGILDQVNELFERAKRRLG